MTDGWSVGPVNDNNYTTGTEGESVFPWMATPAVSRDNMQNKTRRLRWVPLIKHTDVLWQLVRDEIKPIHVGLHIIMEMP